MSQSPGGGAGTRSSDPPAPVPRDPSAVQQGRGLGLVLAALAGALVVAAVVVTAVLVSHRQHHTQATQPLHGTVFQLRPGQCIDFGPNGTAVAHLIPCAQPHNAEIYGAFTVASSRWPGTAALGEQARRGCQSRLSGYLNPQLDPSGMAEFYVYPNSGAWAAGGRSIICEIRGTHAKLTGSVRASGG